jgi:hypothetical protein
MSGPVVYGAAIIGTVRYRFQQPNRCDKAIAGSKKLIRRLGNRVRDIGNIGRKDILKFCVSIQFFAGENCANLAFIFCEMREQTESASETKRLPQSSWERGRLNSSRLVSKQNPPLF